VNEFNGSRPPKDDGENKLNILLNGRYTDLLKNTPQFPEDVYHKLPNFCKKVLKYFKGRERDMMLLGLVGILSGCLTKVSGIYNGQRVYLNEYMMILAPSANGKGCLSNIRTIIQVHHDKVTSKSLEDLQKYEKDIEEFERIAKLEKKKKINNKEISIPKEQPTKPKFKSIIIPADISAAAFNQALFSNDGEGIIFETESDVLTSTLSKDWGDYSSVLRKSFHHEPISQRRAKERPMEINCPKLSIVLVGTPGQFFNLIHDSENGLFSRFSIYNFSEKINWRYRHDLDSTNLNDYYSNLGHDLLSIISHFQRSNFKFSFKPEHLSKFNKKFTELISEINWINEDGMAPIIYRLGLKCFRIAGILSAVYMTENTTDHGVNIICPDEIFEVSISICETLFYHASIAFKALPKNETMQTDINWDSTKIKFYELLPKEFKRSQAVDIGNSLKMDPRTIDNWLVEFLGEYLEKIKHGTYSKLI